MNGQPANEVDRKVSGAVTTKMRPLLFVGTYLLGVIIATGVFAFPARYPYGDWWSWVLELLLYMVFLLPGGLVMVIQWLVGIELINAISVPRPPYSLVTVIFLDGPFPGPSNGLGWVICLSGYLLCAAIPMAGSLTRKEGTFRILYAIFVGLLLFNIGGCGLTS